MTFKLTHCPVCNSPVSYTEEYLNETGHITCHSCWDTFVPTHADEYESNGQSDTSRLLKKIDYLKKQNGELVAQNEELRVHIQEFRVKIVDLEKENEKLKSDLSEHHSCFIEYDNEIDDLHKIIKCLLKEVD